MVKLKRMRKEQRDEVVLRLDNALKTSRRHYGVETLSSDALKERHWKDIRKILNVVDDDLSKSMPDDTGR